MIRQNFIKNLSTTVTSPPLAVEDISKESGEPQPEGAPYAYSSSLRTLMELQVSQIIWTNRLEPHRRIMNHRFPSLPLLLFALLFHHGQILFADHLPHRRGRRLSSPGLRSRIQNLLQIYRPMLKERRLKFHPTSTRSLFPL